MFFESIKFVNKEIQLLEYHRQRIISTLDKEITENSSQEKKKVIEAAKSILIFLLTSLYPPSDKRIYKCRVTYNPYDIANRKIQFTPYSSRPIHSLQLVNGGNIVYDRKYTDRSKLNALSKKRGKADDVLIVSEGKITDTSYCNVVFFDGNKWITPDTPLLKGVMRSSLIDSKIIQESSIGLRNLLKFKCFKLINSMRDFQSAEKIPINKIFLKDVPILK